MFLIQLIMAAVAAFSTFTYATPIITHSAFTASNFFITDLSTHQPSSNGTGNHTQKSDISFTIRDPDPLAANATAHCTGKWILNGTYPSGGYVPCGNTTFGWNFVDNSYKNSSSFTLQVKHTFSDPSIGAPPYDRVTIFGKTTLSSHDLACSLTSSDIHKGDYNCHQGNGTVIKAPIWATMAK